MNYIEESVKILHNYRRLQLSVMSSERRLARLLATAGPSTKITATMDLSGIRASTSKDVEQTIFEMLELQGSITETKEAIREIDQLLVDLSSETECDWYADFLKAWYVNKLSRKTIEQQFNYGERNIYNMREKSIKAFAVAWFGIRPLKGM